MKRKIIKIDEETCNGCGECVPNCPEGALQIIDGKARLVGELLCDGLGACIGKCPLGAITIEEREAEEYNEKKAMENVIKGGPKVIQAHLKHLKDHGQKEELAAAMEVLREKKINIPHLEEENKKPMHAGCPGSRMMDLRNKPQSVSGGGPVGSELGQWPIQLQLVSPNAPYFKDADLVIAADCVPFAYGDFHRKFLKDKALVLFCPKLDKTLDEYIEKLSIIFKENNVRSITLVHMEVPCCYGLVQIVEEALKRSGKNIIIKDYTIAVNGGIV